MKQKKLLLIILDSVRAFRKVYSKHFFVLQDALVFEEFYEKLPDIQKYISDGDLLVLTADHGNDSTDQSTDHKREYVPLLCASTSGKKNVNLGVCSSFAAIDRTAAEFFGVGGTQLLADQSIFEEGF